MSDKIQIITIDGISGPTKWAAPASWEFDRTSRYAWAQMCQYIRRLKSGKVKLKRDIAVLEGQVEALASLLARCNGMSATYWYSEGHDLWNRKVEQ